MRRHLFQTLLVLTLTGVTAISGYAQTVDSVCYNTAPDPFISAAAASGADDSFSYEWQDSTASGTWSPAPGNNDTLIYQPTTLTEPTFFRRKVSSAACGEAYSNTLTVHVFDLFDSTSTSVTNVACNSGNDGSITVNVTGGLMPYAYAWSSGGSVTNTNSGLTAGTYTVSVTDAKLCDTLIYTFSITEPTQLIAGTTLDSNVSCNAANDGGATATESGGTAPYTYAWSNSATTASITGIAAGVYSVTVTDANGCTDSASVTITEPAALIASSIVDSNASCNAFADGGATASETGGTGPYTYAWSNSATTASITGISAGTYSVTITDANGCTDSSSVIITEPAMLVASSVLDSNVTCNSLTDGGASVNQTGGTGPYTYLWSNSTTDSLITGVGAGTYSVTVTDANGCFDSASVTIAEPTLLLASVAVDSNVSCFGFSDGAATSMASGGTSGYTYLWSNAAATASISGVAADTYTVTITDANGCTDSASVVISEPDSLDLTTAVVDVTCNSGIDGEVNLTVTGGTVGFDFLWSNTATTANLNGVAAGTYTVMVTDANGCMKNTSATVAEPAVLDGGSVLTGN